MSTEDQYNFEKHPKRKPEDLFPLPPGYFEALPDLVMEKVQENEPRIITLWSVTKLVASIAAIFIVCIGITRYTTEEETILAEDVTSEQVSAEEIIDSGLLSENDLIAYADDFLPATDSHDSDIEEYLIDQNSDMSFLLNDL